MDQQQQQHQQAMNMMNTQPPQMQYAQSAQQYHHHQQQQQQPQSSMTAVVAAESAAAHQTAAAAGQASGGASSYVPGTSALAQQQQQLNYQHLQQHHQQQLQMFWQGQMSEIEQVDLSVCLSVCVFPNKILLPNPSSRFFFLVAKAESLSKQKKKKKMQQIQMLSGVCNSSWICFWVESLADPFGVLNIFRKCVAPCPMESPVCLFFFLSFPSVIPWRMDSEAPGDLSSSLKDSGGACSSCSWWSFFPAWRIWEATDVVKFHWRIWQATDVVKLPWRIWSCLPPPLRFLWRIGEAPGSSWCFPQEFWKASGSSCKLLKIFPSRIREAPGSSWFKYLETKNNRIFKFFLGPLDFNF